jgi:hypothetical protein
MQWMMRAAAPCIALLGTRMWRGCWCGWEPQLCSRMSGAEPLWRQQPAAMLSWSKLCLPLLQSAAALAAASRSPACSGAANVARCSTAGMQRDFCGTLMLILRLPVALVRSSHQTLLPAVCPVQHGVPACPLAHPQARVQAAPPHAAYRCSGLQSPVCNGIQLWIHIPAGIPPAVGPQPYSPTGSASQCMVKWVAQPGGRGGMEGSACCGSTDAIDAVPF